MMAPGDINISFEPLGQHNETEWDELVMRSHNGHLMAMSGFFRYHADRFEDASLFIRRDGNKQVAVLPANRDGDTLWSHQGVSFGGLVMHPRARFEHVGAAVPALLDHLRESGITRLMYRPAPHPYMSQARDEDIYFLEKAGARRVDTKMHSMVICAAESTVMSKRWPGQVRQVRSSGVGTRSGTEADLPLFWAEVERILAGHGQRPVHTLDDIRLLRERFPNSVQLLVAEGDNGEFLAGYLTFKFRRTITGMYLGETETGRELSAGTLIKDHLFKAQENAGCWFDLGQWCDTDSREESESLLEYKQSMGGRLIQRHTWQVDL